MTDPRASAHQFAGVAVTPKTAREVVSRLRVPSSSPEVIVGLNLHAAYLYQRDQAFAEVYDQAGLVLVDGQPVRWALNARRGGRAVAPEERIGSVDWIQLLLEPGDPIAVAVVGGSDEVNAAFGKRMSDAGHRIVLSRPGYPWSAEVAAETAAALVRADPQLTIVGLGMPLQEHAVRMWMQAGVPGRIALVGGALDQVVGAQRKSPTWASRFGVEWLWRLALSPRRLGHRYLIEPWLLLWALTARRIRR